MRKTHKKTSYGVYCQQVGDNIESTDDPDKVTCLKCDPEFEG